MDFGSQMHYRNSKFWTLAISRDALKANSTIVKLLYILLQKNLATFKACPTNIWLSFSILYFILWMTLSFHLFLFCFILSLVLLENKYVEVCLLTYENWWHFMNKILVVVVWDVLMIKMLWLKVYLASRGLLHMLKNRKVFQLHYAHARNN